MSANKISKLAIYTRWYRKWHRLTCIFSLTFFLVIAITGLLLIWKKNSNGYLLSPTLTGSGLIVENWVSIDSLQKSAISFLTKYKHGENTTVDRIDIRPDKGIAKITFKKHYSAIQIDLTNGKALLLETRRADFIEQLHEGSLFDRIWGTNFIKLFYGSMVGFTLIFLSVSGFFLWSNPGRIKKIKFKKNSYSSQNHP